MLDLLKAGVPELNLCCNGNQIKKQPHLLTILILDTKTRNMATDTT